MADIVIGCPGRKKKAHS